MKLLAVFRIFALMLFIFTPAFSVMLFAAFVLKSDWWFQALGLPALIVNGIVVYAKPVRAIIGRNLKSIAGLK